MDACFDQRQRGWASSSRGGRLCPAAATTPPSDWGRPPLPRGNPATAGYMEVPCLVREAGFSGGYRLSE